jgi:hypothetical protein
MKLRTCLVKQSIKFKSGYFLMASLQTMVVLMLIIVAMLLAAGCVGQAENGKIAGNITLPVPITSSIPTPIQIEPSQVPQEGYWINIDPISDKYTGEVFTITSTTNLSVGTEVLVQVYSGKHFNGPKMQTWEFYGATGSVKVIQGNRGINTISFVVNSSTLYNSTPLQPDEYIVTEDAILEPVTGTVLFNVLPAPDSYGKTPLKPKNFIDWEKLDLPLLNINNSMQPEIPKLTINLFPGPSQPGQLPRGSIVVFSPDSIVRVFDKNGTQIAAYMDFNTFRSAGVPSGSVVDVSVGNVSTVTYGGERIFTMIHESGG